MQNEISSINIHISLFEMYQSLFSSSNGIRLPAGSGGKEVFFQAGKRHGNLIAITLFRQSPDLPFLEFCYILFKSLEDSLFGRVELLNFHPDKDFLIFERRGASLISGKLLSSPEYECSYLCGVLTGFVRELQSSDPRCKEMNYGIETMCCLHGSDCCQFLIAHASYIQEHGHNINPSVSSIQNVLDSQRTSLAVLNTIAGYPTDNTGDFLQFALDRVLEWVKLENGMIRLITDDKKMLFTRSICGDVEKFSEYLYDRQMSDPSIKQKYATQNICIFSDLGALDVDSRRFCEQTGIHTACILALTSNLIHLGTLTLYSHSEREFTTSEKDFLCAVARQIGITLQNCVLHEKVSAETKLLEHSVSVAKNELRARNMELEIINAIAMTLDPTLILDKMLRSVVRKMTKILEYDGCAIYLSNQAQQTGHLTASFGKGAGIVRKHGHTIYFGKGYAGRVLENGCPIYADHFDDVAHLSPNPLINKMGIKTYSIIPLVSRGRIVGAMNLIARRQHNITSSEKNTLEAIGNLVGMAIENSSLYEQTQTRARMERIANRIAEQLSKSLNPGHIYDTAARELCLALNASSCIVAEILGDMVIIQHDYDPTGGPLLNTSFKLNDFTTPLIRELRAGNIVAVENAEENAHTSTLYKTFLEPFGVRSVLFVPLINRGSWRAVLAATQMGKSRLWSQDDIRLARLVATHTALSAENANLFERTSRSEKEYASLYNDAPDMYHTVNKDGYIIRCNRTEARILGYSHAELTGKKWSKLCTDKSRVTLSHELNINLVDDQNSRTFEIEMMRKDGVVLNISARAVPLFEAGKYDGASIFMRDITEQKLLEMQLAQSQKMESLGTLAGGIAHDFNNILTGIMGYANLIKMETDPDDDVHKFAKTIERSGNRAADLIRRMLSFARTAHMEVQPLDLNIIINESVALLSRSFDKNIEIVLQLADNLPKIEADPIQMEQIILNLCVNARDSMPQGGRITITTGNEDIDKRECPGPKSNTNTTCVALSVTDTGTGMNQSTVQRIFDPFFTTKEPGKGTGLGLSMVYSIVSRHHGTIRVESMEGKGSSFIIQIPVMKDMPKISRIMERFDLYKVKNASVLIIDAEELVRSYLCELLSDYGIKTIAFADGYKALEYLHNSDKRPDVCLMDVTLPGIDSLELYQQMREIYAQTQVIIMYQSRDELYAQALIAEGVINCVKKPCKADEVLLAIQRVIKEL